MANEDLISGGTASIATGSKTVYGQNVSWARVMAGDFFGAHVGLAIPIEAAAGGNLTLAFPWPGASQTDAPYAIQQKGDVTRFQERIRLLVEGLTTIDAAVAAAVEEGLADFVGSAPELLRSLADFAAAIGNDPNFAATIFAQLGFRLRVDTDQGLSPAQMQRGRANLGLDKVSNLAPGEYPVSSLQASAIAAAVATEASARSAAIAQLVGSAPEFLDTFAEIAAAIGNNPNFLTTILTALGLRLRVDAPQNLSAEQKLQGKANLDLDRVDNTPDDEKPISQLMQEALDALVEDLSEEGEGRAAADKIHDDKISAYGSRDVVDLAKKYARSGYDIATFGTSARIISGLRKRDNIWVMGSGIETSDVRIASSPKWNRSGVVGAQVDKLGNLIQGQRPREKLHEFGADGIKTRHQSWRGLPNDRFSRSLFPSAEIGVDQRIINGSRRDGVLYLHGSPVVRGDDNGSLAEDYVVYSQAQGSETHIFSERKRDGRRLRLSTLGANHYDPQITRDGKVIWISAGVLFFSPINVAEQRRVVPLPEFIGAGDSLTEQNYGAYLQALSGLPYRNIGKSAQTSTGVAARFGARQMRLISTTGQIPASGSVQVASVDGLGVMDFYGPDTVSGIAGTVLGIPVTIGHNDATKAMMLSRTTAGVATPMPPGTPFVLTLTDSVTGAPIINHREMILVACAGRNDIVYPYTIVSNFELIVGYQATLTKRFFVIPSLPSKDEVLGIGGEDPYAVNRSIVLRECSKRWPDNTIDMLAAFIAAGNPQDPDDAAAMAAGYPPPSLMQPDRIHPNEAGKQVFAATINNRCLNKGWY